MTIVTDPLFYLLAIPAVTLLGLGKGGFAGVGMIATPLLALALPPLQAAAIILPILIVQDAISVWVYRRDWDAWNLKVLLIGSVFRVGIAALLASRRVRPRAHAGPPAERRERRILGGNVGLHLDAGASRRAAVPGAYVAA